MPNAIYCHQCAKQNTIARKFCLDCGTPLHLRGKIDDKPRICSDCTQPNPSFAKFCTQCSSPLFPAPSKGPGANIPLFLINRQKAGKETCPGCGTSAEPVNQLIEHERGDRTSFMGPDGLIMEKPSWLERNLHEPQRVPRQHKGFLGRFNNACIMPLVLVLVISCLLISGSRALFPTGGLGSPLLLLLIFVVGLGLVWAGWSYQRRASLSKAQFRWRQARYCARCDAVYVAGENLYSSPRNLEDILWNSPSQFA